MKSEIRDPKSEGSPRPEARMPGDGRPRISGFGLLSDFGIRISAFLAVALSMHITSLAAAPFRFTNITDKSVALFESDRPVLVYNHGVIQPPPGVPADRARSSYIHPLYGLDGEVLT